MSKWKLATLETLVPLLIWFVSKMNLASFQVTQALFCLEDQIFFHKVPNEY